MKAHMCVFAHVCFIIIGKGLQVVDHEVDVAQVVEVEVRGKLVRNNRGSRCYKVLEKTQVPLEMCPQLYLQEGNWGKVKNPQW